VFGQTSSASGGVHGKNTASGPGVIGEGGAFGVHGISGSGSGVNGTSADGFGVAGTTNTSHGLDGLTFGSGASGVSGRNFAQDSAGANGVTGLSVEGTGAAAHTANIEAIVVGRNFRGGYAGAFDSDLCRRYGLCRRRRDVDVCGHEYPRRPGLRRSVRLPAAAVHHLVERPPVGPPDGRQRPVRRVAQREQ
jgi:hypothetical protein